MVRPGSNTYDKALGLRERKKQKTRWAVQEHALRLFAQQGYEATTIDQIAAAAEISPSTFFRYFKTKEDVVLENAYHSTVVEAIERTPDGLTPVGVFLAGLRMVIDEFSPEDVEQSLERFRLVLSVPALRARTFEGMHATTDLIAGAVGRRLGREDIDFDLRVYAQACAGAMLVAVETWVEGGGGAADVIPIVERALGGLETGFASLAGEADTPAPRR